MMEKLEALGFRVSRPNNGENLRAVEVSLYGSVLAWQNSYDGRWCVVGGRYAYTTHDTERGAYRAIVSRFIK